MIKFIIPAVLIILLVLFWEKISEIIYKKLKLKLNYIMILIFVIIIGGILILLYY